MSQYQPQINQYDDGIPDSHDNDGDLATYNTQQAGQAIQETGVLALIKNITLSLYYYLNATLQSFPIISFLFTWFFIISIPLSLITRWFQGYFVINFLRQISVFQYFGFLLPISVPISVMSAAALAFHGSRIEEMRGSSYLLCFILIITILTYTSMTILQLILNLGDFSKAENLSWVQRNISLFDSYGWEFLPFAIILLHGFITQHPYISLMASPLRLHMTPTLCLIALLYGITHWFHLPMSTFIAIGITWAGKYLWLSKMYTRLTGLLFVPALSKLGPVERNLEWCYDSKLSDEEQMQQTSEYWGLTEHLKHYVIPLLTTEQFGEVVGTATIIQRKDLVAQYSQLSFQPGPRRNFTSNNYSSISNTSLPSSSSNPPPLALNSLDQSSQNSSMINSHPIFDHEENTPRVDSTDSIPILSSSSSDEGSALLVEPHDQTCFDCNDNPNGQLCLNHLKFKSFVYKHTKSEFHPLHVQYYNFPCEPRDNTSQQV